MYGFEYGNESGGEHHWFPRRYKVQRSTPAMRGRLINRGAKLMGALRGIARTLPPSVMNPWLGLDFHSGLSDRMIGERGRPGQETRDATSILILIVVVAHEQPVTFREIEYWLPHWARNRRDALGELLEAELLVIEPITSHEPARFSVSAEGRVIALTEAVHLLLSIG